MSLYDEYLELEREIDVHFSHWGTLESLRRFLCNHGGIKDNYLHLIGKAWNVQDDWVGEDRTSFMNKIKEIREMLKEAVEEMGEGATLTRDWNDEEHERMVDRQLQLKEEFNLGDNIQYEFDSIKTDIKYDIDKIKDKIENGW